MILVELILIYGVFALWTVIFYGLLDTPKQTLRERFKRSGRKDGEDQGNPPDARW